MYYAFNSRAAFNSKGRINMESIKLSANRWHKVGARLIAAIKVDQEALAPTVTMDSIALADAQMTKLNEKATALWSGVDEITRKSATMTTLRQGVARKTSASGALLAELNGVQGLMKIYKDTLSNVVREGYQYAGKDAIDLEDVAGTATVLTGDAGKASVRISLISRTNKTVLGTRIKELESKAYALQEKIAEENQRPISIAFEEDQALIVKRMLGE
jgi:hypothetical protein